MILVFDASAVVKLAVEEDGHKEIISLLADEANLVVAPDLMVVEVGNALWRKCIVKQISTSQASDAMAHVLRSFPNLAPSQWLVDRALALAIELNHPVYDCIYLACAMERSATLVTSDTRLLAAATRGGYADVVRSVAGQ